MNASELASAGAGSSEGAGGRGCATEECLEDGVRSGRLDISIVLSRMAF